MVVLTLLAIMMAAVVPVYRSSHESVRADRALRDLVAILKFAQERAITDATEYRVYLDPEEGAYWLMRMTGIEDGEKVFQVLDELYAGRRRLPEKLAMEKPRARRDRDRDARYIAFYPTGACDVATIDLRRDDGQKLRIKTGTGLGRLEVAER